MPYNNRCRILYHTQRYLANPIYTLNFNNPANLLFITNTTLLNTTMHYSLFYNISVSQKLEF